MVILAVFIKVGLSEKCIVKKVAILYVFMVNSEKSFSNYILLD